MEIYCSINGVLRNLIQKFDYHYKDEYLNAEDEFEYNIITPVINNNLQDCYKFSSKEQFEYFFYIEYVLEIFGHAGLSNPTAISDLNMFMNKNSGHTFTLIGLDELGKAKPATLFFLSKNGFMGNNIKFIKQKDIPDVWEKCDYWITDDKNIIDACPDNKIVVKFKTPYNEHFTNNKEISNLNEIEETWLTSLENPTTLTWTESPKNVD